MAQTLLNINQYGSTYGGASNAYQFYLVVTLNSQSTANNTSNITITHSANGRNGWGYSGFSTPTSAVSINSSQKKSATVAGIPTNGSSVTMCSWTGDVTHNSDGTLNLTISATYNPNTTGYSYVPSTNTLSGSVTLPTIPRASDVSVSNYSITNTSGTLSATITSKANFYHRWRWKIGSSNWSAWTNKGLISTTSSTVSVANTTLLSDMPTATSASFTIEVATYSDSGYATHVGTKSASCTVSINTSYIKPTTTLGNVAINSSPISGYAVAGYSKVQSAWTASGGYGSNGVTTYFTVSTGSLATSSSTATSGTVVSNTIPTNASNYTLTIYAYSKDSRGAVGDTASKSITVYGYQAPTATLKAYRVATSTSTAEDGAGVYVYVTFSGAVRSTVNSQNSIQSTVCRYTGSISGTATNGQHIALADSQSATFTLTVRDKVTSSTAIVSVAPALYPLDLYDNGQGTIGVGFGTTAVPNRVTSALHIFVGESFMSADQVQVGSITHNGNTYVGCHSLAGKIFLRCAPTATDIKALSVMNHSNVYKDILTVDQNNNVVFQTGFSVNGGVYLSGNIASNGMIYVKNYITTNTDVNASLANNNVSSTIYPTTMNIVDNANRIIARSEAVVNPNGNIGMNMYVRNYNTSGGQVAQKGIQFHMNKSGNLTYTVSDNASFREAIGVAYATVTATLVSSANFTTLNYPSGFTNANSVIINWAINTNTASNPAWATGHGLASGSDRTFVQQNNSNILFYNNQSAYYGKTVRVVLMKIG